MAQTPEERRAKRAQYMRDWTARNRERSREIARASRARNRESLLERKREYYARNREQVLEAQREYRERAREPRNAQKREHWVRNRDEINEGRRAQRAADPEGTRAQAREKYWRNPERARSANRESYSRHRESRRAAVKAARARDPERERARQREAYRRNPDKIFVARLLRDHGMYPEDWAAMWDAQDGLCYLCSEDLDPVGKVVIEHDHSCCTEKGSCPACRRGLAHSNCNSAIGLAADSPDKLRRMADALEAAQSLVRQRKAAMSVQQDPLFPELGTAS